MSLPDEILLMIFSYVPLQDIKCLRLVSHCFLNCSSQFLLWSLGISSASRSLHFYRKISTDDLFRKGISKIVYHTRLNNTIRAEYDNVFPDAELAPDAFDQCYSVHDLLCYGIPRLPLLREITITDRAVQLAPHLGTIDISTSSLGINQSRRTDDQLSLFLLLRALSVVNCRPKTFRISVQNWIPGMPSIITPPNTQLEKDDYGRGYGAPKSPSLFDRCLTTAIPIFEDLRHLSIITQIPSQQSSIDTSSSIFTHNLCAFISTAASSLQILELEIHENITLHHRDESLLLSPFVFSLTPTLFPDLREMTLNGVWIEGFSLIAFLSRQSSLEELRLREVYLTSMSSNWASIVDDLRLVLGVQFKDMMLEGSGKKMHRERIGREQFVAPMERIRLELQMVFEPGDVERERGISIESSQLRGYFEGMEDNPLRSCYENFAL
jgi:F-box-like